MEKKKKSFKITLEPQPSLQWSRQLPRRSPKKRPTDSLNVVHI